MSQVEPVVGLAPGLSCRVVAAGRAMLRVEDLPAVRGSLASMLSGSVLKQCDEQTLAALVAMQAAKADTISTAEWGIVACPINPGRRRLFEILQKFGRDGAWSVTPHFIPHSLLHSQTGLVGQAFGLHGPSAGVGGVPGSENEAALVAGAFLAGGDLPGVWLIKTKWTNDDLSDTNAAVVATVGGLVHSTLPAALGDIWSAIEAFEGTS
jgi:hypothetical protein